MLKFEYFTPDGYMSLIICKNNFQLILWNDVADSCTNTKIEDFTQYGTAFGMSTKQLVTRQLKCISPYSATTAPGGIEDVRAEDITAIHTESGVRIKLLRGEEAMRKIYTRRE